MTRYVCVCFCGQVSTKYLDPFCAIPRILCAADNPCALPGPAYFPELALMHAAASVMLETVLASGEHRVLAQKLHQEKRDEYDKHKQQQAALLAHRRVETDTEERHRLEIVKRAFVHRVDACAMEVETGRERAVAQVAKETGKSVQDATGMVRPTALFPAGLPSRRRRRSIAPICRRRGPLPNTPYFRVDRPDSPYGRP
jgi:hypothetical protein